MSDRQRFWPSATSRLLRVCPNQEEKVADQPLRWSSAWWSPPPESNRRPHPYHEPCTHRCAAQRLPRSLATVEAKLPKENPGCWTRRRAFAQVRHDSNIQLLPYSLAL